MADNGLDNCANRDGGGGFSSLGYNLADDASCSFTAPGDLVVADARLYPLGNFGGPTKTHYLMTGSPAIDAGSANCPPPQIDQRGEVRPFDGDDDGTANCDIGAVEYMPEPHRATAIVAGTAFLGVLYRRRWNTGAHENKTFEKSYVRVL
jgi:hypothetical protein